MSTIELLQSVLDYIEENLTSEISGEELANIARFSEYHFYHLFSDIVGMPVAAYITKRRIQHAIYRMSQADRMIDVVLAYGFDTYACFYKAFKREFGCGKIKKGAFNRYEMVLYHKNNLKQLNTLEMDDVCSKRKLIRIKH